MKFIVFNILVFLVVSEVETVVEDGIEWTKMPIEFEEVSNDVEEPIKNNVYLGEGVTNYGTISNGVTEEIAMMFKTLNNIDYDVTAKPIIR